MLTITAGLVAAAWYFRLARPLPASVLLGLSDPFWGLSIVTGAVAVFRMNKFRWKLDALQGRHFNRPGTVVFVALFLSIVPGCFLFPAQGVTAEGGSFTIEGRYTKRRTVTAQEATAFLHNSL